MKYCILLAFILFSQDLSAQEYLSKSSEKEYKDAFTTSIYSEKQKWDRSTFCGFITLGSIYVGGGSFYLIKKKAQFLLIYRQYKTGFPFRRKNIKIDSIEISEKLALGINDLFLNSMREPISRRYGLDGTNYYFLATTKENSKLYATTWSPARKSKMRKLINVCNKIIKKSSRKNPNFEAIEKHIKKMS